MQPLWSLPKFFDASVRKIIKTHKMCVKKINVIVSKAFSVHLVITSSLRGMHLSVEFDSASLGMLTAAIVVFSKWTLTKIISSKFTTNNNEKFGPIHKWRNAVHCKPAFVIVNELIKRYLTNRGRQPYANEVVVLYDTVKVNLSNIFIFNNQICGVFE